LIGLDDGALVGFQRPDDLCQGLVFNFAIQGGHAIGGGFSLLGDKLKVHSGSLATKWMSMQPTYIHPNERKDKVNADQLTRATKSSGSGWDLCVPTLEQTQMISPRARHVS
jgi:hypothetical protein